MKDGPKKGETRYYKPFKGNVVPGIKDPILSKMMVEGGIRQPQRPQRILMRVGVAQKD